MGASNSPRFAHACKHDSDRLAVLRLMLPALFSNCRVCSSTGWRAQWRSLSNPAHPLQASHRRCRLTRRYAAVNPQFISPFKCHIKGLAMRLQMRKTSKFDADTHVHLSRFG